MGAHVGAKNRSSQRPKARRTGDHNAEIDEMVSLDVHLRHQEVVLIPAAMANGCLWHGHGDKGAQEPKEDNMTTAGGLKFE